MTLNLEMQPVGYGRPVPALGRRECVRLWRTIPALLCSCWFWDPALSPGASHFGFNSASEVKILIGKS